MDTSTRLSFKKCFFCAKNFKEHQLQELNNHSVLISDEEISYAALILDTCLIKVRKLNFKFSLLTEHFLLEIDDSKSNSICTECG